MKRVLIATDGSECAQHAAEFLARLPHDEPWGISVVSVLNHEDLMTGRLQPEQIDGYLDAERIAAEAAFAKLSRKFSGANCQVEHVCSSGNPGHTIVRVAQEIDAELVVLGAQGHSAMERLLLGSTSDYVATHAHCSVLVVRPEFQADASQHLGIVFDGSAASQTALEQCCNFNWGADSECTLIASRLHVVPVYGEFTPDIEPIIVEPEMEAIHMAAEELKQHTDKVTVELRDATHVGESIVGCVRDQEIDLVVIGESERTELGRFLLGSTTRYVLRHSPSSVWITRTRKAVA